MQYIWSSFKKKKWKSPHHLKSSAQSRRSSGTPQRSGFSFFKMFLHNHRRICRSSVEFEDLRADVSRIMSEHLLIYIVRDIFMQDIHANPFLSINIAESELFLALPFPHPFSALLFIWKCGKKINNLNSEFFQIHWKHASGKQHTTSAFSGLSSSALN